MGSRFAKAHAAKTRSTCIMKTFRTLDLAVEFYDQAKKVPLTGNLKDQLHRASSSIALNLSEGNAKSSANEKRHFFQMAYGSIRECQTIFRLEKVDSKLIQQ